MHPSRLAGLDCSSVYTPMSLGFPWNKGEIPFTSETYVKHNIRVELYTTKSLNLLNLHQPFQTWVITESVHQLTSSSSSASHWSFNGRTFKASLKSSRLLEKSLHLVVVGLMGLMVSQLHLWNFRLQKRDWKKKTTLPETNIAPENGWFEH